MIVAPYIGRRPVTYAPGLFAGFWSDAESAVWSEAWQHVRRRGQETHYECECGQREAVADRFQLPFECSKCGRAR